MLRDGHVRAAFLAFGVVLEREPVLLRGSGELRLVEVLAPERALRIVELRRRLDDSHGLARAALEHPRLRRRVVGRRVIGVHQRDVGDLVLEAAGVRERALDSLIAAGAVAGER